MNTRSTPVGRRGLPPVHELAAQAAGVRAPAVVRDAARRVLREARSGMPDSAPAPSPADLVAALHRELDVIAPLRRVVNATGVLLHTNLGRAPLPGPRVEPVVEGAVDLELDLVTGRRGRRLAGLESSLCALTGAEAALVVNNNAGAVLLAVSGLAAGREVIVSRGQLVEIGGSFRVPEVIAQGGARLVEVGTTNRTHPDDYRAAVGEHTAAILEVHPSNYRVEGFTASVPTSVLAGIAAAAGLPLVIDLGAGLVDAACPWLPGGRPHWLADEPGVAQALGAGADVVTFSGDKLLGGPQAGVIVGRAEVVDRLRRHPLARALRFDRTRVGLLQWVVDAHLDRTAATVVPFWRMATATTGDLARRADILAAAVDGAGCSVEHTDGLVGAGSAPAARIGDVALRVQADPPTPACPDGRSADHLAKSLRRHRLPVVTVVRDGSVWVHLRTVDPSDDDELAEALRVVRRDPARPVTRER